MQLHICAQTPAISSLLLLAALLLTSSSQAAAFSLRGEPLPALASWIHCCPVFPLILAGVLCLIKLPSQNMCFAVPTTDELVD